MKIRLVFRKIEKGFILGRAKSQAERWLAGLTESCWIFVVGNPTHFKLSSVAHILLLSLSLKDY